MPAPLPKHPNIVLLANNIVGLNVAKYLHNRRENIVALIVHSGNDMVLTKEIINSVRCPHVFTESQLKNPDVLQKINSLKPDIAICAFFNYILKKEFIELFSCGVINCHNSYLPYNRGKYPQVWALATGSPYGVSIHYVDERIDTGDIISRQRIIPSITDTGGTLYEKSLKTMVRLFVRTWTKLLDHTINPVQQNTSLATHHFAHDIAQLDVIYANNKYRAIDLINQIRSRSFTDRTYAYFIHGKKKVYVKLSLSENPNIE